MSRHPGRDEQGRPVVAELGRAETAVEAGERRAAASARRRANQTAFNLVAALLASLAVVAFLVLVVVRPDAQSQREPRDYATAAAAARAQTGEELLAPALPAGWWANRTELAAAPADGVPRWEIGFVTPGERYIALTQGIDAGPGWISGLVAQARPGPVLRIGGLEWTSYDRRATADPGLVEYALVAAAGSSTIVLAGTAGDAEFELLAEAIADEVRR